MNIRPAQNPAGTILLIGASRWLGLAMAGAFLKKGWNVVATGAPFHGEQSGMWI